MDVTGLSVVELGVVAVVGLADEDGELGTTCAGPLVGALPEVGSAPGTADAAVVGAVVAGGREDVAAAVASSVGRLAMPSAVVRTAPVLSLPSAILPAR